MEHYTDEKSPLTVEVLPIPVTYVERKRPSFFRRLFHFTAIFLVTIFLLNYTSHAASRYLARPGCQHRQGGGGGQKPLPPHDKWHPYKGSTHFELEEATGLSITGSEAFGKVVFETSKLSDKIVIDLKISTKHKNSNTAVAEKDGYLTVTTDGDTHADAKISIPSGIINTVGLPKFDVNVPRYMIDYSSLPESLEIGAFTLRAAKGFIKTGPVHTNSTQLTVGDGAIRGKVSQAQEFSVDVANGNVTLDITSDKDYSTSNIKLGNGHLKGSYPIYNSTTFDVAKGSIYINARFESQDGRGELNTKVASGPARVFVDSIAAERLIEGSHVSVSGDQIITYPSNFQGTVDARGIAGEIVLAGDGLEVEKVFGGLQGKKGDSERNYISVKAAKGKLDILVGDE